MRTADSGHRRLPPYMRIAARLALPVMLAILAFTQGQSTAQSATTGSPIALGYRVIAPEGNVWNGATLEFYVFWDSLHYEVSADLSQLDTTAEDPVAGHYQGELEIIAGDTTTTAPAYWFTHTISAENARADSGGIVVPIRAANPVTGVEEVFSALTFCLINDPLTHIESGFLTAEGALTPTFTARNGDSLRIATTWHFGSRPFLVSADFSAVDDSFAASGVYYWLDEALDEHTETYAIYYELDELAKGGSEADLPIRITVTDGACGRDSVTLVLTLDNEGPAEAPVLTDLPDSVATLALAVRGTAPEGSADVLLILNGSKEYVAGVFMVNNVPSFEVALTLAPGRNTLKAYARDEVGNRSPATEREVFMQEAPQYKGTRVFFPERQEEISADTTSIMIQNGDLIRFQSYWDARDYEVYADLRPIDSTVETEWVRGIQDTNVVVTVGDGLETWYGFTFTHRISAANTLEDDRGIYVPVMAYDPELQIEVVTHALEFCLGNHAPKHLGTMVVGDDGEAPYRMHGEHGEQKCYLVRNLGTMTVYSSWESANRPMSIHEDFSAADAFFESGQFRWFLVDSLSTDSTMATYGINYKFSRDAWLEESGFDPYPLVGKIIVGDMGCRRDTTTICFEMDIWGPQDPVTFTPEPPAEAAEDHLIVSGTAGTDAIDVLLRVEHSDADSTTRRTTRLAEGSLDFTAEIPLLSGHNILVAFARDEIGNYSEPSVEYDIFRFEGSLLEIPKPLRVGEAFTMTSPSGWSEVEIEIYNLEGDRIRTWVYEDATLIRYLNVAWNGLNGAGQPVKQGPYLARFRMTDASGNPEREEVRAFVFKR